MCGDTPRGAGSSGGVWDQAWDGPVDQVAVVCQVVEVHLLDRLDPSMGICLIAGASEND